VFIEDSLKLWVYRHWEYKSDRHTYFLSNLKESVQNDNTKHKRFQNLSWYEPCLWI